jgi:hypothetical protein
VYITGSGNNPDAVVFDAGNVDGAGIDNFVFNTFIYGANKGIYFTSTGTKTNRAHTIMGGRIWACIDGIYVEQGTSTFSPDSIRVYGTTFNNNEDDIHLAGGWLNSFYGTRHEDATSWNVHIEAGVTHNKFISCNFEHGRINNTGNDNRFLECRNFVTENSGTATILAGATSATVNHGLDPSLDPSEIKITITPRGNLGNCWVTGVTSTSFTIDCSSASQNNVRVDWYATI